MPKNPARPSRIAVQIQRELAELVRMELKDPRVGMVTFTDVEVARDYGHAKVFFTTFRGEAESVQTGKTLQHAAGFLRSELSHRLKLRTVPQLHFVYDSSIERGVYLSKLIAEANLPNTEPPQG